MFFFDAYKVFFDASPWGRVQEFNMFGDSVSVGLGGGAPFSNPTWEF